MMRLKRLWLTTLSVLLLPASLIQADSINLTTYYPAPFGSYTRLRLTPQADGLTCNASLTGLMYMSSASSEVKVCNGTTWGSMSPWTKLPGSIVYLTESDTNAAMKIGIGTQTPEFKLTLHQDSGTHDGGIMAQGTHGAGTTLTTAGAGTRFMWYPRKSAFRAGQVDGTQWDDANIGIWSVGLGFSSRASGIASGVLGGHSNQAQGDFSSVLGGRNNVIHPTAVDGLIGGGEDNTVRGQFAVITGGQKNAATGNYSFVGGGGGPGIVVPLGGNTASANLSTIVGGSGHQASGTASFIGGGQGNVAWGVLSFVGGGQSNQATADTTVVVGGDQNQANSTGAAVLGGSQNIVTDQASFYSTITGGRLNRITNGFRSFIGSGETNSIVYGDYAAIVSGLMNSINGGLQSFIGAGTANVIQSNLSVINGGDRNTILANSHYSVIGGGVQNRADSQYATVSGGLSNTIDRVGAIVADYSFIGGGQGNRIVRSHSAISGGQNNQLAGSFSTIPGGQNNVLIGNHSFVGGRNMNLRGNNSFLWGHAGAPINVDVDDSFIIYSGNVLIGTNANAPAANNGPYKLYVNGRLGGRFDGVNEGEVKLQYHVDADPARSGYYATYAP